MAAEHVGAMTHARVLSVERTEGLEMSRSWRHLSLPGLRPTRLEYAPSACPSVAWSSPHRRPSSLYRSPFGQRENTTPNVLAKGVDNDNSA
jgi:hypothetical protein